MVKGFIFFRTGKIPFVIENYRMDLFTDDSLLEIFCKEYNFKENYILQGLCFDIGPHGRKATFLVENSMGSTCYLRCYIVYTFNKTSVYKGYKQDKIEMRGDRAEMSDFPLYLNTVAGGLDRRDQTIGGFSFVVKIYAVPVV